MHAHEVDPGQANFRHLSVQRQVDPADPEMAHAATSGRADALSTTAVLHLQRLAGNSSVSSLLTEEVEEPSPVHEVIGSPGGAALETSTRAEMEARLGHDFGDVRIHTGAQADASARSLNAQAYTVGTDVVFESGKFAPDTKAGMRTLAHELTHVVQQKLGPVAGSPVSGGIMLSDPSDSFEQAAERTADRAMAEPAMPAPLVAAGDSISSSVQREAKPGEDEEDEVQTLAIQRATGASDEELEDEGQSG